MQLQELLRDIEVLQLVGPAGPDVREPHFDSRKVQAGDLFVAVPGTQVDGHAFIDRVIGQGAKVIVCERLPAALAADVTYVQVASASLALGIIANAFHGRPSESMVLVGVTGTNGKTTTATLLYRLFTALGHRTGLLSTIRNYAGDDVVPSTHTTGDALQIASLMARMVAAGCTHCLSRIPQMTSGLWRPKVLKYKPIQ
jgi:UDP-N-acetylmuramoyl-L-alanyl-D-glutamate--2,6-diaminopimelate ligase